jgi:hypothetical protein
MFGIGKQGIALSDVAEVLANTAFRPIQSPTDEDIRFREEAATVGVDTTRFVFESAALELCAVGSTINSLQTMRRIGPEQASLLRDAMFRSYCKKVQEDIPFDLKMDIRFSLGMIDSEEILENLAGRIDQYSRPENRLAPHKSVPGIFVRFCGVPDPNEILLRIGWALFVTRGNTYLNDLKSVRIL